MSPIVIVTGMSGAGRSTCLKLLEDLGFEAVDNLPIQLLTRLLRPGEPPEQPLAIGIDSRTRGLVPPELVRKLAHFRGQGRSPLSLLFLECDDEVLRRRYTESRRRHPLATDRPVMDGIARERVLMAPLKAAADLVVDTSATAIPELRRWVASQFGTSDGPKLTISLISFAFRNGLPREADIVFDLRFLRNPHYVEQLRPMTGLDAGVQAYVAEDPDWTMTMQRFLDLMVPLLHRYRGEGKSYLAIAVGCTGGRHRSVFAAEHLSARLAGQGWDTVTIHRELPADERASKGPTA